MREHVVVNIRSAFVFFFNITKYIKPVLKIILQQVFQYIFFHVYFFRSLFLAYIENCDTCFIYSNISFLVFLTFWIYSYANTNFQVLSRYFPFCKKILSFFRSSSAVLGLGPIETLCLLKERPTTVASGIGLLLYSSTF